MDEGGVDEDMESYTRIGKSEDENADEKEETEDEKAMEVM